MVLRVDPAKSAQGSLFEDFEIAHAEEQSSRTEQRFRPASIPQFSHCPAFVAGFSQAVFLVFKDHARCKHSGRGLAQIVPVQQKFPLHFL